MVATCAASWLRAHCLSIPGLRGAPPCPPAAHLHHRHDRRRTASSTATVLAPPADTRAMLRVARSALSTSARGLSSVSSGSVTPGRGKWAKYVVARAAAVAHLAQVQAWVRFGPWLGAGGTRRRHAGADAHLSMGCMP